jgi:hypothetical protein
MAKPLSADVDRVSYRATCVVGQHVPNELIDQILFCRQILCGFSTLGTLKQAYQWPVTTQADCAAGAQEYSV